MTVYTALFGGQTEIGIKDFSTLSSRRTVFAKSDDYPEDTLTNSIILEEYCGVIEKNVTLGRHVIVGSGSTILLRVEIDDGCAVGTLSLINKPLEKWAFTQEYHVNI